MAYSSRAQLEIGLDMKEYLRNLREAQTETRKLIDITKDFAAINDEITRYTSFSYLAKEQVNKAIGNLGEVAGQSWEGFKTSTGKQLEKAFGETWDAFTDNIGELDNGKLEKAWDQFGDSLVEGVHSSWHGMLENMGNALTGQSQGPEVFPRALGFGLALFSGSVP